LTRRAARWASVSVLMRPSCRSPLGLYFGRAAAIMLSRTDSTPMIPVALRSSVRRARSFLMASAGEPIFTDLPWTTISPLSAGYMPKIVSSTSVRPAPIRPAKPRISPRRTSKLTSAPAGPG
jgi:hypothetical protein